MDTVKASSPLVIPDHLAARATWRPRDMVDTYGLSRTKVHALIRSGRLSAVTLDGCVLIPREAVEAYIATARPLAKK